jgi:hypothetical protein
VAFSVQDFHDLVRLLEERPEWRTEVRRLVLSEELLRLPDVVASLAKAQQRAEERLSGVEDRLSRVEERLSGVEEGLSRLETVVVALGEAQQRTEQAMRELAEAQRRSEGRLDRLEDHVAALRGDSLERRYREHADGYFGRLLRRVRVVGFPELDGLLDEAMATGALDEDTALDVRLEDLIVGGRRPGEDGDTFLVVEVSVAIDADDVERAARRAAALGQVRPTLPVVAGDHPTSEAAALAAARGVWQILSGRVVEPSSAA